MKKYNKKYEVITTIPYDFEDVVKYLDENRKIRTWFKNFKNENHISAFDDLVINAIEASKFLNVSHFPGPEDYIEFEADYLIFSGIYNNIKRLLAKLFIMEKNFPNAFTVEDKIRKKELINKINLIIKRFNSKISNLRYNFVARKNWFKNHTNKNDKRIYARFNKINKFYEFDYSSIKVPQIYKVMNFAEKMFDKFIPVEDWDCGQYSR